MIIQVTPTKPPPSQNGCSSKSFLQIILTAKWLVRHSIPSPNQQRRPLISLLSGSYSKLKMHLELQKEPKTSLGKNFILEKLPYSKRQVDDAGS